MNTKFGLFLVTFLCALCMGFTSCSDDNDDDDYAKAIAGDYKGVITIADAPVTENTQVTIKKEAKNSATLTMKETVIGLPIDIACKADVTFANNTYAIAGETTFNLPIEGVSVPVPVPVKINGTGDQSGNVTLNIQVGIPDGPVAVVYKGKKQ
jgi:hypothetical protein